MRMLRSSQSEQIRTFGGCARKDMNCSFFSKSAFTAEKRNKHARVLAARQTPSLKNGGNFVDRANKKSQELHMLSQFFPVSSNILKFPMESWCIVSFPGKSIFLGQN